MTRDRGPERRESALEMSPEEFRALGHRVVDKLADFLASLPGRRVTAGEPPSKIRALLGRRPVPSAGTPPGPVLEAAIDLLKNHSLFNGHPRFWGYITSSAAPAGALADLVAATLNPNVGSFGLAPAATEIEAETVRWIAELAGYPVDAGGILVSGGNMANMVCFLAARRARAGGEIRESGMGGAALRLYTSKETHTWIQKAADLFGLGTNAIRWIPVDGSLRMDPDALRREIRADRERGDRPFLVVGTAGSVSTGAVDPLPALAAIAREEGLWFHVDGAYGGFAALLPDASSDLKGLAAADSLAVDPHKWLYAPLEVGCALVREKQALLDAFSYRPPYYLFHHEEGEEPLNFYELGPQNSRGFRALKVWLAIQQAGRDGYVRMIGDDIRLTGELFEAVKAAPEMEAFTLSLSIATFRYVPARLRDRRAEELQYLNELNTELLTRLQAGGEAFLSNAVVDGVFLLRACLVNFRTTLGDVLALPEIVARIGRETDAALRPRG